MDNRTQILHTALQLFSARGYDAVGVQEISDAAAVTKPTLYHYFGNKRGLLETLLDEWGARLLAELSEAARYAGDLPATLERVVRTCFRFAQREPAFYRLILALWFTVPEGEAFQVVAAHNARQHEIVEAMFRRAADDHGNMRGRHRAYAATFLGMIHTYVGLWLNGYTALDESLVHQAVHQFSHGIYS